MIVVVPMAGRGSRYATAGISIPKPLVSVGGKPMVLRALKSLEYLSITKLIFIGLREHQEQFDFISLLTGYQNIATEFVLLDDVTEGQLCTVLTASQWLNSDEDLLIAASDTYIKSSLATHILNKGPICNGLISVATLPGDRWSFARTDDSGRVVEVAEKRRISDHASTGLYYFSSAREFVSFGESMIRNREKTMGEYYVIPVYQKMIEAGKWIGISQADEMWDMGTPEAKEKFEHYLSTQ
jgi:NDP-sugar pyrophosphorylase family protein